MSWISWGRKGSCYGPRAGEWVHGGMCSVRLAVMYVTMTLRSNKVMPIVRWMMQVMGMRMMTAMSSIMRISRVEGVEFLVVAVASIGLIMCMHACMEIVWVVSWVAHEMKD